jgi:hypothetical protein
MREIVTILLDDFETLDVFGPIGPVTENDIVFPDTLVPVFLLKGC